MTVISSPILWFAAAALSLAASPVSAVTLSITTDDLGMADTESVLFDDRLLLHSGLLVQGNFRGSGAGYIVDFTSSSGNQHLKGSGGLSTIEGRPGNDPFTSLTFGLEGGATFTRAVLNPNPRVSGLTVGDVDFAVNYLDAFGSPFLHSFSLAADGNDSFHIQARDGARITGITVSTIDRDFVLPTQFRLGGFVPTISATSVPETGTTVVLLGVAVIAVGAMHRKLVKRSYAA